VLRGGELEVPLRVSWKIMKDEVMTGEHVGIVLMVNNLERVTTFDSVAIPEIQGGIVEEEVTLGTIETEKTGTVTLYNIPAASYMLTPLKEGTITIPQASVTLEDVSGTADRVSVRILSAPVEIRHTGAIGEFSYVTKVDYPEDNEDTANMPIHVYQRIEGCGNFGFFTMPGPEYSGLRLVDQESDRNITASLQGYCGYLQRHFTLRAIGET
jgi:hypothetical protein